MSKIYLLLALILLVAAITRLYNLNSNPPAAYGDEISFAWNAWNILKTGGDEYGSRLPLQFRAFDDYKAPIPVYLLVPFLRIWGLQTWVVRFPVALAGIATVGMIFLLVKYLLGGKAGLVAAMLLAISPWHMHLSRGYFESTLSLLFFVTAVYFFVKAKTSIKSLYISALFFVLCLYTYFTPRIFLLLFIPFLLWWSRNWILKHKKTLFGFFLIIIVLSLPLVKVSLFDKGLSRIDKLTSSRSEQIEKSVVNDRNSVKNPTVITQVLHNRYVYWVRAVGNDYLEHFSFNFLFLYGDSSLRYFLGNMGMLYVIELPFIIWGMYSLVRYKRNIFWFVIGWFLLAPIPAAIAGRPFAVRSLAMLPAPLIFESVGLLQFWHRISKKSGAIILISAVILLFGLSFVVYIARYHLEYPTYAATWWGWENKAAIDKGLQESVRFEQIFISNYYTGAELALAYYTGFDPLTYQRAKENPVVLADGRHLIKLGKFYIGSLDLDQQRLKSRIIPPRSLYIGRPEEPTSSENIVDPGDGRILFNIYRTN